MLNRLSRCLLPDITPEIELDLLPNGSLGENLGLCMMQNRMLAFDRTRFLAGETAHLLREMESKGQIDERWKILPHCIWGRALPVSRAQGEKAVMTLSSSFHTVKLKYRNAALFQTKAYLQLMAVIL